MTTSKNVDLIIDKVQCIGLFSLKTVKRIDNEESFKVCMIMTRAAHRKKLALYCVEVDDSSIHLQSPFFEHDVQLENTNAYIESPQPIIVTEKSKKYVSSDDNNIHEEEEDEEEESGMIVEGEKSKQKKKKDKRKKRHSSKTKKKNLMLIEEENDNNSSKDNEEEEEEGKKEKEDEDNSSVEMLIDSEYEVKIIDDNGVMQYFANSIIYRLKKWDGYVSAVHLSSTKDADTTVLNLIKNNFYYCNLIASFKDVQNQQSLTHSNREKKDFDRKIHQLYPKDTRFPNVMTINEPMTTNSLLSILWHDNKDSMTKLKKWLTVLINSITCTTKGTKYERCWDTINSFYTSENSGLLETNIMGILRGYNEQYILTDPNNEHHNQQLSNIENIDIDQIHLKKNKIVNDSISHFMLSSMINEMAKKLQRLTRILPSLICAMESMERIFSIFNQIQQRCDYRKENELQFVDTNETGIVKNDNSVMFSLKNIATCLKVVQMSYTQLDDTITFLKMMNFVFCGKEFEKDETSTRKSEDYHDYTLLMNVFMLNNLLLLVKLYFIGDKIETLPQHNICHHFIFTFVLRYIIQTLEKKSTNITRQWKSTIYTYKQQEIKKEAMKFHCSFSIPIIPQKDEQEEKKKKKNKKKNKKNKIEELKTISIFCESDVIGTIALFDNLTIQHNTDITKFIRFPFTIKYSKWFANKSITSTTIDEDDNEKTDLIQYAICTYDKEFDCEMEIYSLIEKFKQYVVHVFFSKENWINDNDHKEEEEEEEEEEENEKMKMKLTVFNTLDLMDNIDLEIFYDKYFKDNLFTTLVIRPYENFYVNKKLYSFFTQKDELKSTFHSCCKTTNDLINEEKKIQLSSYGYDTIFIPYAHLYTLLEYRALMLWIESQSHKIKTVIITGAVDIIPSQSFGQPFVDHLRTINDKVACNYIFSHTRRNEAFSDLITQRWINLNTFHVFKNDERELKFEDFFHDSIKFQILSSPLPTKLLVLIAPFHNYSQAMRKIIDASSSFIENSFKQKHKELRTNGNRKTRINPAALIEKITIHHIEDKKKPSTIMETGPKVTIDKIYIDSNLYKRKLNLVEQYCHFRLYTITLSYFNKLTKNEKSLLFSILDNIFIINDTETSESTFSDITSYEFNDYVMKQYMSVSGCLVKNSFCNIANFYMRNKQY
jgi:hypothetical protein